MDLYLGFVEVCGWRWIQKV